MYSYFKSCYCLNVNLLHHHSMHVQNELVEIVTTDDREFEEIIDENEEEVLTREEVSEPPPTDSVDNAPA